MPTCLYNLQVRSLVYFSILCCLLAACAADQPQAAAPAQSQTAILETSTATATNTPTAAATLEPEPTATNTLEPTAVPTEMAEICTPLGIHPLEELPEIIGDGYDPPRPGREERHHGIDFGYYHYQDRDSMLGEPVQSVLDGQVASVLTGQYPYGNMVMIETGVEHIPALLGEQYEIPVGKSLYILYAHLDQPPQVNLGDMVTACQPLGVVGMSGNTDIPHLHIETRWGPPGQVFESMRFYDTRATQAEMDAYVLWRTSGVFQHFDPLYLLAPQALPTPTPTTN
jgi:murein DD-endopeptidase MepM/ murein hydrolase activator NlpD